MIYRATTLLQNTGLGMKFYRCSKLISYDIQIGPKEFNSKQTQCHRQVITYRQWYTTTQECKTPIAIIQTLPIVNSVIQQMKTDTNAINDLTLWWWFTPIVECLENDLFKHKTKSYLLSLPQIWKWFCI